jgi:hypothetical protein
VAISVAIVIPLIGFDEFPINPLIREATVTNSHQIRERAGLRARHRLELQEHPDHCHNRD